METRIAPPYRAEHVGSLIRPLELREARGEWLEGRLGEKERREIEDRCIREVVAMQESLGLMAVTDGEFRRTSWREGFFEGLEGFSEVRAESTFDFRLDDGGRRKARSVPDVVAPLVRTRGIATDEFVFLKGLTSRTPKVTLPAPSVLHFFRGDAMLDRAIYPDVETYMADVARIYREEIADLAALGCTYLQIDEVALPIMCDPAIRETIRARSEDPEMLIGLYIDSLEQAVRDRPANMTVCVHMCRGNEGHGIGSGGYEPIAERVFSIANVAGYFLEYDTPRAGDFAPLRLLPDDRFAVLGLMSTKTREVEPAAALRARIEEAARHVDMDRLCVCPQCGFASGYQYSRLTIDEEKRKLERLVEVAEAVWGAA